MSIIREKIFDATTLYLCDIIPLYLWQKKILMMR
jgi:hypothetical protein